MRSSTIQAAQGKWSGVLSSLGIDERHLKDKHGPCPVCGGKDRFRFDNKEGSGSWYCSHCEPHAGYGIDLAMNFTGLSFKDVATRIDRMVGNAQNDPDPTPKVDPRIRLKAMARSLKSCDTDNPVTNYLKSRGVSFSPVVQYCPKTRYFEVGSDPKTFSAMVCLIQAPNGAAASYHVTYLHNGKKAPVEAPKKILPPVCEWAGGAIRLFPISESLGIAEGIETALAVTKLYGIPCWAAVNANNLEKFVSPEGVKELHIFGDNDESFTGQKAAFTLARRLHGSGVKALVHLPEYADTDFADVLKESINNSTSGASK